MFYKHPRMADGYLNKCKNCAKKDVKTRYYNPIARLKIIEYEKTREKNVERKRKKLIYQRRRRSKSPGKNRARYKVGRAIKDGRLIKKSCEVCRKEKTEAHHSDYRKYLDVTWLCRKHHMIEEDKIPF